MPRGNSRLGTGLSALFRFTGLRQRSAASYELVRVERGLTSDLGGIVSLGVVALILIVVGDLYALGLF